MRDYIMVIDEGTTGTRALIFDKQFKIISSSYTEFTQYTPAENMVEHDFEEIYQKTVSMCQHALMKANLTSQDIACLGITNQRCTVCFWDKVTGKPLMKGIVWQDNRAADILDEVLERPYVKKGYDVVKISPGATRAYTQIEWCMRNMPEIAQAINNRSALFGTIDTWLVWKLTGGQAHVTDATNAARTMIFDIHKLDHFIATKWPRNVIRTKGVCYFSHNPDMSYLFEQAGTQKQLREAGLWYATAPEEELARMMQQEPGLMRDWDERYGDRMIKLVFIGQHLDKGLLARELDACLE